MGRRRRGGLALNLVSAYWLVGKRMNSAARLLLPTLGLLLCSCSSSSQPQKLQKTHVAAPPTATEVFDLRSKCAELGQKIMDGNLIGSALRQDQVSHYNPETNRCYVQLDVSQADLTKYQDYY